MGNSDKPIPSETERGQDSQGWQWKCGFLARGWLGFCIIALSRLARESNLLSERVDAHAGFS